MSAGYKVGVSKLKIVKKSYSRGAWRLVDDDGMEVVYTDGEHGYILPVCAETKNALISRVLDSYQKVSDELRSAKLLISVLEDQLEKERLFQCA